MTKAIITSSTVPSKVSPDKRIPWQIGIRTAENGTNDNYIGGAMFKTARGERRQARERRYLRTHRPQTGEPRKCHRGRTSPARSPIRPLTEWKAAIPNRLEWVAIVGWLEKIGRGKWGLHGTDRRNHAVTVKRPPPESSTGLRTTPRLSQQGRPERSG